MVKINNNIEINGSIIPGSFTNSIASSYAATKPKEGTLIWNVDVKSWQVFNGIEFASIGASITLLKNETELNQVDTSSLSEGDSYYVESLRKLVVWNGSEWLSDSSGITPRVCVEDTLFDGSFPLQSSHLTLTHRIDGQPVDLTQYEAIRYTFKDETPEQWSYTSWVEVSKLVNESHYLLNRPASGYLWFRTLGTNGTVVANLSQGQVSVADAGNIAQRITKAVGIKRVSLSSITESFDAIELTNNYNLNDYQGSALSLVLINKADRDITLTNVNGISRVPSGSTVNVWKSGQEWYGPTLTAGSMSVDTTDFGGNLSSGDDTVQKVIDKLDGFSLEAIEIVKTNSRLDLNSITTDKDIILAINTGSGIPVVGSSNLNFIPSGGSGLFTKNNTDWVALNSPTIDASGFTGNLDAFDRTLQNLADKVDSLDVGAVDLITALPSGYNVANYLGDKEILVILNTSTGELPLSGVEGKLLLAPTSATLVAKRSDKWYSIVGGSGAETVAATDVLLGTLFYSAHNNAQPGRLYAGQTYLWSKNPKLKALFDANGHGFITDNGDSSFTVVDHSEFIRAGKTAIGDKVDATVDLSGNRVKATNGNSGNTDVAISVVQVGGFFPETLSNLSPGDNPDETAPDHRKAYFGVFGDAAVLGPSIDAEAFDGNLDDTVIDLQKLAEAVDTLETGNTTDQYYVSSNTVVEDLPINSGSVSFLRLAGGVELTSNDNKLFFLWNDDIGNYSLITSNNFVQLAGRQDVYAVHLRDNTLYFRNTRPSKPLTLTRFVNSSTDLQTNYNTTTAQDIVFSEVRTNSPSPSISSPNTTDIVVESGKTLVVDIGLPQTGVGRDGSLEITLLKNGSKIGYSSFSHLSNRNGHNSDTTVLHYSDITTERSTYKVQAVRHGNQSRAINLLEGASFTITIY